MRADYILPFSTDIRIIFEYSHSILAENVIYIISILECRLYIASFDHIKDQVRYRWVKMFS